MAKAKKKAAPKKSAAKKGAPVAKVDAAEQQAASKEAEDAQQAVREYHAGKYQTHDPVTGEKRGPQGPFADIDKFDTFSKRDREG